LDDSDLTIAQVAFASGFGSIRHFNRAMREVFRSSPHDLRERRRRHDRLVADGGLALRLPFNPPLDWDASLCYLARRAIPGAESVQDGTYRRTIVLDGDPGVLEIRAGGPDYLLLRAHLPYWEGLIHVVERAARMLGIDLDLVEGEAHLAAESVLAPIVQRQAGLRVPGAWGPFEMGVQAIVSENLDLESTRTVLGSMVRASGTRVPGLLHGLTHAFPSAETVAGADLLACGMCPSVASTVKQFASAVATHAIRLDGASGLDHLIRSLVCVSGVNASTAHQIALRLGYSDAFPQADPMVLRALQQIAPSGCDVIDDLAERWRPWRALAATHLVAYLDVAIPATLQEL
jgi:AraC family transcriptional regulator of adaptative response / DNA-3-methyladenine glycosylase II